MTAIVRPARTTAATTLAPMLWGLASVAFLLGVVLLSWTGYTESDDSLYAEAAWNWAQHFPFLGINHWGLRHAIVLPMALLFRLFGRNETTLEAPMLLYYAALLVLTFAAVRRIGGWQAALIAAVLLGAMPTLATTTSVVVDDVPETFFVMASLWAFYSGTRNARVGLLVLSGAMAGLGFITRETTSAVLIAYGVLFLMNYGGSRLAYVWMGVGFVLVVGIDTAWLWAASGDPLYRLHISLLGVHGDNPSMAAQFQTAPGLDRFGDIAAPRWLQAFLILFVGQHYGLLFWAMVPAAIMLAAQRQDTPTRRITRLFGLVALVWFVVLSYVFFFLWILPRYQLVTAVLLVVPLSLVLARMAGRGRALLAGLIVLAILASDVVLIALTDRDPLWAERTLVSYAQNHAATVQTDPGTLRGAEWLLQVSGIAGRVRAAAPEPGQTYFYDAAPRRGIPQSWPVQRPAPNWVALARFSQPGGLGAVLVRRLGLRGVLPGVVLRKLDPSPRTATLYRIPATPG